ncbi:6-phosphogluconolactonase [Halomonas sp. MCCC 1A17488]|uniref:6-phosphogluconolactonase n=1 Tax=Billgrantia sulfidoxydans TaxID=2733484 RepID=A0ABX7W8V6_9GAMM|nr:MULTISPECIES: 6-phosphogluconolactonase [Halomonas]MCE8018076.1 6-phosphogluconolactonase [Halomonas sp. MCCC 1A17488]MCG3241409.1 6-phosphogluconolactonase [Halomonas sp. MCCC 1A17488]QPP48629.1 6-phosphogluconolactonase [Halomonas sp. SS10-MC5]QTP55972.1 6-phosphogluconolactonase [Halomonas sulfidoxydans]
MTDLAAEPRQQLAAQLAEATCEALRQDLAQQERALLVVSGGSTPVPYFQALSRQELPWERVDVTLADERWVSETDAASNALLVRRHLLQDRAAAASFVSLTTDDETPEQGVEAVTRRIEALAWPASLVVLGMGGDGHTASLFPDSRELELGLTTDAPVLAARTPSQPQARISLSADRLHQARRHVLYITGDDKRSVLARALSGDDLRELPIRAFLSCPLAVYWAP